MLVAGAALSLGLLPSTAAADLITVTTLTDSDVADGLCSLREAIEAANSDAAYRGCPAGDLADQIDFGVTGTIALNADLQEISGPLTISGPGRDQLTVDGVDQHSAFRIDAPAGELLTVENLTISGASGGFGGAFSVAIDDSLTLSGVLVADGEASFGAGIYGEDCGEVRVLDSEMRDNRGNSGGGAAWLSGCAELFVQDSTLAANFAGPADGTTDANGGALVLSGTPFEIRRSTLSGNGARGHGGAIYALVSEGSIRNSTVTLNFADPDNDGHSGGGLRIENAAGQVISLANTIVADNEDSSSAGGRHPDFSLVSGTVTSQSFNWIGDRISVESAFPLPGTAGTPNVNADFVGDAAAPLDPQLNVLADYGGPTRTHRPALTSGVLDQADCPVAIQDQRGYRNPTTQLRTVDLAAVPNLADGCDIGSFERGAEAASEMPFLDGFESGDTGEWSAVEP
jgi:CSLREA domain-containing protein